VSLDQSSRERGVERFRTTRWNIVLLSAQSHAAGYKEALGELCNLYWYPLYAFVRRRGYSPEDAQDLTQGFFLNLLEHKALTRVAQQNEEGSAVVTKIIDLGLAKIVHESGSQATISTLGTFAGTPEFASREQFAGVAVDIRSDLYSLGITLWEMLTGKAPFLGTPAEVMHQHLHAPLPLNHLIGVPQPVIVLLGVLLEKDPKQRFQSPAEFLKAMPTITGAIDKGSRITRQILEKKWAPDSHPVTRSPTARLGPKKISTTRLPVTGSNFFGREADIGFLDDAWENKQVNVVTIVAWAGVGKSTLVNHWLLRMAAEHFRSAELVFGWSFYRQGTSGRASSADEFLDAALSWFGDPDPRLGTAWEKGDKTRQAHRASSNLTDSGRL
jgi:hypothetical protein